MFSLRAYEKGASQSLPQVAVSGRRVGKDFDTKNLCNNRCFEEEGTTYGRDVGRIV